MFSHLFFGQALHMPRSKNSSGVHCPKYKKLRTSRLSRSAHVPDPGQVRNGYGSVKLKVGDTECPLQVCQLSRSSETTHFRSFVEM